MLLDADLSLQVQDAKKIGSPIISPSGKTTFTSETWMENTLRLLTHSPEKHPTCKRRPQQKCFQGKIAGTFSL